MKTIEKPSIEIEIDPVWIKSIRGCSDDEAVSPSLLVTFHGGAELIIDSQQLSATLIKNCLLVLERED